MNVFPLKLRQLLKVSFFSFIYLIFFLGYRLYKYTV